MVKEGKLPFVFKKRPTRIGVLPRYAESGAEVRWFDTGARLPSGLAGLLVYSAGMFGGVVGGLGMCCQGAHW